MGEETNSTSAPGSLKRWLWPAIVLGVALAITARVYYQQSSPGLDGRRSKAELLAEVSTPDGARKLEKMLQEMADPRKSVGERAFDRIRSFLPEAMAEKGSPDEKLMNMLQIMEKLPPEYKIRYMPIFIEMLDHPENGTLATEELEKLAEANSNVFPMMVQHLRMEAAEQKRLHVPLLQVLLRLDPEDPDVFNLLANSATNKTAAPALRVPSINALGLRFASHPETHRLLTITAADPDPEISSVASAALGLVRPPVVPATGQTGE